MPKLFHTMQTRLIALIICCLPFAAGAQQLNQTDWDGEWLAEGTLFRIGVKVEDGILKVSQLESMGQVWNNEDGEIDGNVAKVKVDYAGASGIIQAELINADTAVLFAASCQPDFMMVCVLSKDRQAVFRKVDSPALDSDQLSVDN